MDFVSDLADRLLRKAAEPRGPGIVAEMQRTTEVGRELAAMLGLKRGLNGMSFGFNATSGSEPTLSP